MKHILGVNRIYLPFEIKDKLILSFWIVFFWFLIGLYQYADGTFLLIEHNCIDGLDTQSAFLKGEILLLILLGAFLGTGLVLLWGKWLRKLSVLRVIFYVTALSSILHVLSTSLFTISFAKEDPSIVIDNSLVKTILYKITNFNSIADFLFWLFICLVTVTVLMVRDKFGPNTFTKFLTGRYFHPKREERIFMFMDLKSSTTIAEKLGEERYFNFLNDTFKASTKGILSTYGEIYQYVGDEIVISWSSKRGLYNANCIRCFFEVEKLLQKKADYFKNKYGVMPEFKAGLHFGNIIAGEIGIVKREIVYSGDVLNTTSRIQALCNEKQTNVIISKKLINEIDVSSLNKEVKEIGVVSLRGKIEKVELTTLSDID